MVLKNIVKTAPKHWFWLSLLRFSISLFYLLNLHRVILTIWAIYNTAGFGISDKYYVNQQLEPSYAKPNELSKIMFSIQDRDGRDVHNVIVMVEIYSAKTNERVSVFPWTRADMGILRFRLYSPKIGNYEIVLSVLNDECQQQPDN